MSSIQEYLNKTHFKPRISLSPHAALQYIIVIPCHEEPDLEATLNSLEVAASKVMDDIEIVVVVNDAVNHSLTVLENNLSTIRQLRQRINKIPIHTIYETQTLTKKAGVGYARKIGMDEAAARFDQIGRPDGLICSMDADTLVQENYFEAIGTAFRQNPSPCKTIYFEHDIDLLTDSQHWEAIIRYELHLRYYIHALRYAGFPHAFQTLGSAFCVQADKYTAVGGMSQRQAGEDFYFIHKFSKIDQVSEITGTTIYPSSRVSHRVPFGTGRAIQQALANESNLQNTYPLQAFKDLRQLITAIPNLYEDDLCSLIGLSPAMRSFLASIDFDRLLMEIKQNTNSFNAFKKRFYQKMDAFMMMKYMHFLRDNFYGTDYLVDASMKLLNLLNNQTFIEPDPRVILHEYRRIDRGEVL